MSRRDDGQKSIGRKKPKSKANRNLVNEKEAADRAMCSYWGGPHSSIRHHPWPEQNGVAY